jgi:hypothetical protein
MRRASYLNAKDDKPAQHSLKASRSSQSVLRSDRIYRYRCSHCATISCYASKPKLHLVRFRSWPTLEGETMLLHGKNLERTTWNGSPIPAHGARYRACIAGRQKEAWRRFDSRGRQGYWIWCGSNGFGGRVETDAMKPD